jgi:glycosyltransferase involved in cell wall biosynthesis
MTKINSICNQRFELQREFMGVDKIVNSIKPTVSITVSTYQHVHYIQDCLNGILMQKTSFPIEILLGEDESTDGTRDICIDYAEKYPDKIRLFLRDRKLSQLYNENGVLITRFNDVWNRLSARGKYIAWCDGDDYWTDPLKLQKQVEFLENNEEFVLCFHDSKVIDKDGNVLSESRLGYEYSDYSQAFILGGPFIPTNTCLFRNIIDEYPEFFFKAQNYDTVLWHLLGSHGSGKIISNIGKSVYRLHKASLWSSISVKAKINDLLISRRIIKNNLIINYGNSHIAVKEQKKRLRKLHYNYLFQLMKNIPFFGKLLINLKKLSRYG